jgi:hypothetical protein
MQLTDPLYTVQNVASYIYYSVVNLFDTANSYCKVADNLYISDHTMANNAVLISALKIDHIINLTDNIDRTNPPGCTSLQLNVWHNDPIMFNYYMNIVIDNIHNAIRRGKTVLIHSRGGRRRAPCVAACYLVKYFPVMIAHLSDPTQAAEHVMQIIQRHRPCAFHGRNDCLVEITRFVVASRKGSLHWQSDLT